MIRSRPNAQAHAALLLLMAAPPLAADDQSGPAAALTDRFGLTAGGWASIGFTHNVEHPRDRMNTPTSFNNRADEWHLHQLNLFIERPVATGQFGVGGRFDFMFGTDTPFTQATGHWDDGLISKQDLRFYDIALPQAYVELATPWGQGLNVKLGHFYSLLGYEAVPSPPNFFYSHSYSMKSSPFTHTGALLSYPVLQNVMLYSGAVTGADNVDRNAGAWSYLGGFNWTADDGESGLQLGFLTGDVSERLNDKLNYVSAAWRQRLGDGLHYVLQHDVGWQAQASGPATPSAHWYSIVQYLTYDLAESLGVGLRGEWFRDQDGFRYGAGDASYYAVTLGLNWKPASWLMLRPELRYDWADSAIHPYAAGTQDRQRLAGVDAVIQF